MRENNYVRVNFGLHLSLPHVTSSVVFVNLCIPNVRYRKASQCGVGCSKEVGWEGRGAGELVLALLFPYRTLSRPFKILCTGTMAVSLRGCHH